MSILTNRELEFLAGLNARWSKLYWNELALLLEENGADRAPSAAVINGPAEPRAVRRLTHHCRPGQASVASAAPGSITTPLVVTTSRGTASLNR
jgi:hypothetical protein